MSLPPLPVSVAPWSPNIRNAFRDINERFTTCNAYLSSGSLDHHRLKRHASVFLSEVFPVILLLDECAAGEGLPIEWLEDISNRCLEVFNLLDENLKLMHNENESNVTYQNAVAKGQSGRRGRPRKNIDPSIIEEALGGNRRISQTALAKILGVHRNTVRARMKELGVKRSYDVISDEDLDKIVKEYREENPNAGRAYTIGYLRSKYSLRVQRRRVVESMNRVDVLGQAMRRRVATKRKRQVYRVPRPNSLWHIDGHHKLIQWGIVIHAVADGYTRKVTGIRASTNNTADTVLKMFLEAIEKHGIPSRVRGDRGGENRDVSILMILLRGLNRASFMWGSSVFNTRIERLWVEVGRRFVRAWRAFFMRLERLHLLDRKNKAHRWLLHYLFLDQINLDCDAFAAEWNAHPISGAGGNFSPDDLTLMGSLQHGSYDDECTGMTEEDINDFYGFTNDGEPLVEANEESDSIEDSDNENEKSDESDEEGYASGGVQGDEDEESESDRAEDESMDDPEDDRTQDELQDSSEMEDDSSEQEDDNTFDVSAVIDSNIRHEAVPVPSGSCPFSTPELALFKECLDILIDTGDLPDGYGILPEEWGRMGYPTTEVISVGLRKKSFPVSLPDSKWRPRAEDWTRALHVMNSILSGRE